MNPRFCQISIVVLFWIIFLPVSSRGAEGGFNYPAYLSANADLPVNWGKTESMNHYIQFGYWEKRAVSFNIAEYLNANPDLPRNWSYVEGLTHYNFFGKNENRLLAFDSREYLSLYSDLPQEWTYEQAYNHFINYGRKEGRIASFDEISYLELYLDIPRSWEQAATFLHYITFGQSEGRVYDPYDEVAFSATDPPPSGSYALLAWNDLGMHCMDGTDYAVFSILPPYNNLHAQLIHRDATDNRLVTAGVTITYEATPYPDGSINTSSVTPTNFWDYVASLYEPLFGPIHGLDFGLMGNPTQSYTPAAMSFNDTFEWWEAEGIPTDPFDDDGARNFYPQVKVIARDPSGHVLAETTTVLPVSDEMDCRTCHASGGSDAARPAAGWVNLSNSDKNYKFNILKRHDDKHAISAYLDALAQKGYVYKSSLYETSLGGTPVLCSACHASNALPGTGVGSLAPFTTSIHGLHAAVLDPVTQQRLDDSDNRTACYRCHPGSDTQCLRDPMGVALNPDGTSQMSCQSCHGSMSNVGAAGRIGWLAEPTCQSCHSNGQRLIVTQSGSQDTRFATNPDTPMPGTSLFRFSKGHGGLQCEACHGATHAIYPSTEPGDNYQSLALQGHTGTIAECSVCHSPVPETASGGPHGLHTVGQSWVSMHEEIAEHGSSQCAPCHGNTFRGGLISQTSMSRNFQIEDGRISFAAGHAVSCYDCHNGPNGGD